MVEIMDKPIYPAVVTREGLTWLISVDLTDFGPILAIADTDDDIQFMAHDVVRAYTDLRHEDFDITYSFVGGTPAWATV